MVRHPYSSLSSSRRTLLAAAAAAVIAVGGCVDQPRRSETTVPKPAGTDQYVRAVATLQGGDQQAAIDELEQAVVVNPSLRMARMTLGELYIKRKEYEKALPHLEVATELDPYTLRNFYNLGLALQMLSRLQESAVAYLHGLKLDPEDFKSNMNIGLVYFALNQLDASIYHLEKATRIEPNNAHAWSNIGVAYDARGNLVFAEASYRKALELDADSESTLINLTANLITQKKSADAIEIAKKLVKIHDAPLSHKRLGDAYTSATQWDDAASEYDTALGTDKTFLPALNAKAEMFAARYESNLRLDDKFRVQALAAWEQSLKLRSDQPTITQKIADYSDAKVFK